MNNTNFTNYDRWLTTPPDEKETLVGKDWEGNPIYKEDGDDYIDIDGEWVLDDPHEIAEFIRNYYQKVNTYDMEE